MHQLLRTPHLRAAASWRPCVSSPQPQNLPIPARRRHRLLLPAVPPSGACRCARRRPCVRIPRELLCRSHAPLPRPISRSPAAGHFFQPGFGIGARLTNYLYKVLGRLLLCMAGAPSYGWLLLCMAGAPLYGRLPVRMAGCPQYVWRTSVWQAALLYGRWDRGFALAASCARSGGRSDSAPSPPRFCPRREACLQCLGAPGTPAAGRQRSCADPPPTCATPGPPHPPPPTHRHRHTHTHVPNQPHLQPKPSPAALQGFIFGIIGLGAGVVGTATSNGLLKLRKKMDPSYSTPVSTTVQPQRTVVLLCSAVVL